MNMKKRGMNLNQDGIFQIFGFLNSNVSLKLKEKNIASKKKLKLLNYCKKQRIQF